MEQKVIKETANYKLVVTEIKPPESNEASTGYRIVNKEHDVKEIETFILPQALKLLDDLEAAVQAFKDMEEAGVLSSKKLDELKVLTGKNKLN